MLRKTSLTLGLVAAAALGGCVAYPVGPAYNEPIGYGAPPPVVYGAPPVVYGGPVYAPAPAYRYHRPPAMRDRDRDGVPDRYDRDRDGDGVPNRIDRRPGDPRWR